MDGNHNHRSDWITVYPLEFHVQESYVSKGDTHIKSDIWIGMNAMIMPGVTINEGAIISSVAIVTKDVEAYSIVAGNPARHLKYRFSKDEIQKLLELRWFDWKESDIDNAKDLLMSSNIDELYKYYLKHIKREN